MARIYNNTDQVGNRTIGLVAFRHGDENSTMPGQPNMISEDDIFARVTPHNGWVILGLTSGQGSADIHAKAGATIVQLKGIKTAEGYQWIRLTFSQADMLPYDQLCKKLHAELQAKGADFQFEPITQFYNDSHVDWRLFAVGYESSVSAEKAHRKPLIFKKELKRLAAREDGAIYAEDLNEFGDQVSLRTLYGKGDGDGGCSYILRRNSKGNWETFQKAVTLTDEETSWDAKLPFSQTGFNLVVENGSKKSGLLVVLDKKRLGTIPSSNKLLVSVPDLANHANTLTVNVVYPPNGEIERSEFRVYHRPNEARVKIGETRILNSNGTSEIISASTPEKPRSSPDLTVWYLGPD